MANPIYSDLDFNFVVHPVRGDLVLKEDEDAVIRAVKNLLMTNHFEVPFHPEIGCNIRQSLFEHISLFTASDISRFISETIKNFEPRVKIKSISVTPDYDRNGYYVLIQCYVGVSPNLVEAKFLLERIR